METKKDKTMWVFGSTLKESIWKENNARFVSGSMDIYMKLCCIYIHPHVTLLTLNGT